MYGCLLNYVAVLASRHELPGSSKPLRHGSPASTSLAQVSHYVMVASTEYPGTKISAKKSKSTAQLQRTGQRRPKIAAFDNVFDPRLCCGEHVTDFPRGLACFHLSVQSRVVNNSRSQYTVQNYGTQGKGIIETLDRPS